MPHKDRTPITALTKKERDQICAYLDMFPDDGVDAVYNRMFNQGIYIASVRTWYRVAKENGKLLSQRHRRRRKPRRCGVSRATPRLRATHPGQVICWDVTWIYGYYEGEAFPAYIFLDLYSRKIVYGVVAPREKTEVADFIVRKIKEDIPTLTTLHSDNGSMMTSKKIATTCKKLGITQSFIRPSVSNDNAFCESVHSTLKSRIYYPKAFETVADAQEWLTGFVEKYNDTPHGGLGGYTPNEVFEGTWHTTYTNREKGLADYYTLHPDRRPNKHKTAGMPPVETTINLTPTPQQPTSINQLLTA